MDSIQTLIAKARQTNHLDLSNRGLEEIPFELAELIRINNFSNLISLDLSDNEISDLRNINLNTLGNLKSLDLRENHLVDLPDISYLVNLETLDVGVNCLTDAPNIKSNKLRFLSLHNNEITNIPNGFSMI